MTPRTLIRAVSITLLSIALTLTVSAQVNQTPSLFVDAAASVVQVADNVAATRSRVVRVATDLLAAADRQPGLTLALFPDAVFRAEFESIETFRAGQYVWRGTLAGVLDGEVTLAVTDGAMAGQITMPGAQYSVRYVGDGLHVVQQLDTSRLPPELESLRPDPADLIAPDPVPGQAPDDGSLIDIAVFYTPAARLANGGTSGIESLINQSVANTNNSFANSGVTQRMRLVYTSETSYTESFFMQDDLGRLQNTSDGFMDEVHGLRNTYAADIVSLITGGSQNACGIGYLMTSVTTGFAPFAFNVTNESCAAGNLSFAHEAGHNMGLHHDFANAGGQQGAYPYAYGYQNPAGLFRTVMAYPNGCFGGCPRVQHFSTHTRTYGGQPTGVQNASESARALNNTASTVANFRQPINCSFTLSSSVVGAPAAGTAGSVNVMASDPSCAWTAVSHAGFIGVSPSGGTGNGTVNYTVAANASTSSRSGSATIAGHTFTVNQAGMPGRRWSTDFNGDGICEVGVFRPFEGRFYINGMPTVDWGGNGDLPVTGDYNGDGSAEFAVFRPSNGTWYVMGGATVVWGMSGDIPVPGDYNGDGVTDMAVFRPRSMEWHLRNIGTFSWGAGGDYPVAGDWDGDGDTDIAVWRPANGTFYVRNGATVPWGMSGDIPVPADYDADGDADYAVFRPSSGVWYVMGQFTQTWGAAGDIPVPIDRNGDGRPELGVFRGNTSSWYFLNRTTMGIETIVSGMNGDIPLGRLMPPIDTEFGDFDGDNKADLTVFRPSSGTWYSRRSMTSMTDYTATTWGLNGDIPVAGDYDADNKIDPAVYRPSTGDWYALLSSTGFTSSLTRTWGLTGDVPVPADYDGDRRIDFAVYRPSIGRWVILLSSTNYASYVSHDFGLSSDIPVPGDWDGDNRADIAVFRPSTGNWYVLNRFLGTYILQSWGLAGDTPVPGDYDGDGKFDFAVFRSSIGRWVILLSSSGNTSYIHYDFGLSGDQTVPADYDGDGLTDVAVFRPSTGRWYILYRLLGMYVYQDWGLNGDIPATKVPF